MLPVKKVQRTSSENLQHAQDERALRQARKQFWDAASLEARAPFAKLIGLPGGYRDINVAQSALWKASKGQRKAQWQTWEWTDSTGQSDVGRPPHRSAPLVASVRSSTDLLLNGASQAPVPASSSTAPAISSAITTAPATQPQSARSLVGSGRALDAAGYVESFVSGGATVSEGVGVQGQFAWYQVRLYPNFGWTPWLPGWMQVWNVASGIVRIVWDRHAVAWKQWTDSEFTTLSFQHSVCMQIAPQNLNAATGDTTQRPKLHDTREPQRKQPDEDGEMGERLSLQCYGNEATDAGTIADLEKAAWGPDACVPTEDLHEAKQLMEELYLKKEDKRSMRDGLTAWQAGLQALKERNSSICEADERPGELAAAAISGSNAMVANNSTFVLETTPYAEGKSPNYPQEVVETLAQRGVNLLECQFPTGEAALATVSLSGGSICRIPVGLPACIDPLGHLGAKGLHAAHTRIDVVDMQADMLSGLDRLQEFLHSTSVGKDGKAYSAFDRLRFSCRDNCAASSVYAGVCAGHKDQPPLSGRIGQYDTHPHPQFSTASQLALKRRLMLLVNAHIKLAEEQAQRLQPDLYKKQARLREILGRHPVFLQNKGVEPWFAHLYTKALAKDYVGCGLDSKLFTNVYVSIGSRTRGCHTDYRNPPITHLSTRLVGKWGARHVITGQTVLFDRFATIALVVDDSPKGKVLCGGLNGIKHANLGPRGDAKT